MQNPENLRVAAEAEELAVLVYSYTAGLPHTERFGLVTQMRRAAVSIGSNIWEGCGRQRDKSLIPFLHYALGSTGELQFQLRIAVRLGYGDPKSAAELKSLLIRIRRLLAQLIKVLAARLGA